MSYIGDFAEDYATLNLKFTTRTTAGVPTAFDITSPIAAVSVYKANGATQSVAGITLTPSFDGVAGLNNVLIDLSADAFYAIGNDYQVVITTGTVNSVSVVGEVIAEFSIENRFDEVDVAKWLGTAAATPTTAGVPSTALTAIGADAVLKTSIFALAMADAIWDEILTGATHNIATSAGRRLRGLQEFQGYEGGHIFIDTVNGTAGTVDYENGTVENPVDTLADAVTLSASLGYNRFFIINGSTITLASTFTNYVFNGHGWTLALGGQDVSGTHFHNATVSGIATGTSDMFFEHCHMGTATLHPFHMVDCGYNGTITLGAAGSYIISGGHSAIAGSTTPIFDTGAALLNVNLAMPDWHNGVEIQNLNAAGTDLFSISGIGQIIYAASCSGTVNQRGNWQVTNTGGVTIVADDQTQISTDWANGGRLDLILDIIAQDTTTDIPALIAALNNITAADVWDRVISKANHNIAGSSGKILRQSGDLTQIAGSVSDVSPTASDFDTDLTQVDGYFEDSVLVFVNGAANAGIGITVSGYLNLNGNVSFLSPDVWPVTPVNGDDFIIFANHVHPVSQIADGVLDEALSGHTTAGTLGKAIADTETNVAAILVDTNELQGDWTDGGRLDLILDAINAATGSTGVVLTAAERNAIADAMLDRDMSTGTDSGSPTVRTVRQALRANRNKVSISGGTMTVTKEDDSTASWTAAVTTTAGDPISAIDPA